MHRRAPNSHRGDGRQLLTALSQRRIGLLVMELLDHLQIGLNLPGIPPTMRLRLHATRLPVPEEQILDEAQTHSKEAGQVPLRPFSPLVRTHDLEPKIVRIRTHCSLLLHPPLTSSLYCIQTKLAMRSIVLRRSVQEALVRKSQKPPVKSLEVKRRFEPSHMAAEYLAQAYERLVPILHRSVPTQPPRTSQPDTIEEQLRERRRS
jgi:hypothetical protein